MDAPQEPRRSRPVIERIGLAAIAAVMAALFGGVALAAWFGGEGFLAVMGAVGCLMTAWVGGRPCSAAENRMASRHEVRTFRLRQTP
jgi:hypothetical protein